jgi:hypothetical protein
LEEWTRSSICKNINKKLCVVVGALAW